MVIKVCLVWPTVAKFCLVRPVSIFGYGRSGQCLFWVWSVWPIPVLGRGLHPGSNFTGLIDSLLMPATSASAKNIDAKIHRRRYVITKDPNQIRIDENSLILFSKI